MKIKYGEQIIFDGKLDEIELLTKNKKGIHNIFLFPSENYTIKYGEKTLSFSAEEIAELLTKNKLFIENIIIRGETIDLGFILGIGILGQTPLGGNI